MKSSFNIDGTSVLGFVFGLAGIAFGIWQAKKADDIAKKIDAFIEDIDEKTPVEVKEEIVNKAIEKAVAREVKSAVSRTADRIHDDSMKEIKTQVGEAVENEKDAVKERVKTRVKDIVNSIDQEEFEADMKKEAKKIMIEKFNKTLNSLTGEFKGRLGDLFDWTKALGDVARSRRSPMPPWWME